MNIISLPKPPTDVSLLLLLRARLMFAHALEHSSQKTEFNNMIAVLGFDNTIEYVLRTVVMHLDLEGITGNSFADIELASLASNINKALSELADIKLPYFAEIKLLRQTRNLVQHGVVAPYADLERFGKITQRFFEQVLKRIFGLKSEELKLSFIIHNEPAKSFLEKAESFIDTKMWLESVVASRDAFENEFFSRLRNTSISTALYPSIVHEIEKHDITSYGMSKIKEELELTYLGINSHEYRRFKEYIEHIPHEFNSKDSWGNTVMQRPWQKEDAIFCYNYAAGVILRWQAQEKEELYTPKIDKEYSFDYIIAGIKLEKVTLGCGYFFFNSEKKISDQHVDLFYVNLQTKRKFEKLIKHNHYIFRVARHCKDEKDKISRKKIEFLGMYTFLVTNNPERWGVVIWYRHL